MKTKSQAINKNCEECGKNSETMVLCKSCAQNPYLVEKVRNKIAMLDIGSHFKDLYSNNFAEISNVNSKEFWNYHFSHDLSFANQDQMTKEKIGKIFSLLPAGKLEVLDVGFGQGYFEEVVLKKRGDINITGIDISTQAVEKAKKKFQGEYIEGDFKKIKKIFTPSSFDIILAIEVVEHISPENIFSFLGNIRSLLKPNGIFIISTPLNEHLEVHKNNPSGHVREYTIPIIEKELELSGFKVTNRYTFYAFQKFYSFKKLLAVVFRNRWEPNNVVVSAVKV